MPDRDEQLKELRAKCREYIGALQCEHLAAVEAERDALAGLVTEVRRALEVGINSAHPHPVEHPTMTSAWAVMRAALALPLLTAAERVRIEREYCTVALEYFDSVLPSSDLENRHEAARDALRAVRGEK